MSSAGHKFENTQLYNNKQEIPPNSNIFQHIFRFYSLILARYIQSHTKPNGHHPIQVNVSAKDSFKIHFGRSVPIQLGRAAGLKGDPDSRPFAPGL